MVEYKWVGTTSTDPTVTSNWDRDDGTLPGAGDTMTFDSAAQANCQFNGTFPSSGNVHDIRIASDWPEDFTITTGGTSTINLDGFLLIAATSVINASHSLTFSFNAAGSVPVYLGSGSLYGTSAHVTMSITDSVFTSSTSRGNTIYNFNAHNTTLVDGIYPKLAGTGTVKTKRIFSDASGTEFNTYGAVEMSTITTDLKFESEKADVHDYDKIFHFEGGFTALGETFKFGHTTAEFSTSSAGANVFPVTGELNSAGNDTTKVFSTQYHKIRIQKNHASSAYWKISAGKILECNELVVKDGGRLYGPADGSSAVVIKTIKRPTIHGDWNFRQVTDGIYESIFDINVLPVTHGGTGLATVTPGGILYGDGQGNLVILPIGTTGQTLKVHSSGVPFWSS